MRVIEVTVRFLDWMITCQLDGLNDKQFVELTFWVPDNLRPEYSELLETWPILAKASVKNVLDCLEPTVRIK